MTIDTKNTDPKSIYQLLIGAIVPRPIAFVSTISAAGEVNLAPFSFFTVASANPPIVCFCPMNRGDGGKKDTLHNILETKEFVVNIVGEEIAAQMNQCSGDYAPDVNEFEVSGLTELTSEVVKAPRVAECAVQMECRLTEIYEVSALPMGGTMVFGEVIRFHVKDGIADGAKIDPDKLNAIGRMGGAAYSRTRDRFDLNRPA